VCEQDEPTLWEPWSVDGFKKAASSARREFSCCFSLWSCTTLILIPSDRSIVLPEPDKVFRGTQEYPALQISLGWQHDRIKTFIPFGLVWGFLAVSVVVLCTVWWAKGTRDTSTALAFGQLVAALITLVFVVADR
jgi:hypothetical protein